MGHLQTLDLLLIALYGTGVLCIGWWYSRRQVSTEEYFVAGRGVRSIVVGLSMMATLLSTISYLTVPGEMLHNGPGLMWGLLHVPISFVVVGYLIIPRIMRHRITSGYELLEARLGMANRQAASVLFVLVRLTWMGFVIFTCSTAVSMITQVPVWVVLVAVGVTATAYTVLGGIRAVLVTDVLQFIVLFGGALLAIGYITWLCGGLAWWPDWNSPQLADLEWPKVKLFSLNPFDRVTAASAIFTACLWWICTATSDQVMIQRYLCTRDARGARRSYGYCLLADVANGVVLWGVGIALLGYFLLHPERLADTRTTIVHQADDLFPHFIGTIMPAGVRGLLVAGLFSAAMSSLDSGISSISTVLLTDFPALFARGCAGDDRRLLRRAMQIGLVVGAISVAVSFTNFLVPGQNLYDVGLRISEFFVVPLFVLFLLAFFVPFSTPAGGWAAIAVGVATGVLFSYWKQIVGMFHETQEFSVLLIMPATTCLSLLAGILVSLVTPARPGQPTSGEGGIDG